MGPIRLMLTILPARWSRLTLRQKRVAAAANAGCFLCLCLLSLGTAVARSLWGYAIIMADYAMFAAWATVRSMKSARPTDEERANG